MWLLQWKFGFYENIKKSFIETSIPSQTYTARHSKDLLTQFLVAIVGEISKACESNGERTKKM